MRAWEETGLDSYCDAPTATAIATQRPSHLAPVRNRSRVGPAGWRVPRRRRGSRMGHWGLHLCHWDAGTRPFPLADSIPSLFLAPTTLGKIWNKPLKLDDDVGGEQHAGDDPSEERVGPAGRPADRPTAHPGRRRLSILFLSLSHVFPSLLHLSSQPAHHTHPPAHPAPIHPLRFANAIHHRTTRTLVGLLRLLAAV